MANKIQIRRDTAANWTSANPTLSQGEQGYETDTGKLKIGDGSTAWTSLGYSFEDSTVGGDTGVDFNDNVKARFGTGNDLEIYHNGTSSIIENTSAGQYLRIRSAGGMQFTTSGTENALIGIQDSKVGLYYDGSEKLETTSSGIQTTGTVNVNGAYTLPTSDGTNGQVLTTDGSGAVTFATPSGGGSPDLYADNYDGTSTAPSATGTNAVALQDGAVASGNRGFAAGRDAVASGTYSVALGTYTDAVNFYGTAIGYNAQAASGDGATALTNSRASGSYSLAAAIANNTSSYGATGTYSAAIGRHAKATASYASVIGGYLGEATATFSTTLGGRSNIADASYSVASGYGADVNGISGKVVHASTLWASAGETQCGKLVLIANTSNATATALTSDGNTASATNQAVLPNNSAHSFSGTIIAREDATDGSDYASWEIKGALLRDANAASTVLGNGIVNKLYATSGASTWAVALSADTTNGGLKVEVTGAASTNIRWVATVNTSEVTYA